ncbi:MAG: cupredoxin family copper-binding protein [bacterium]
MRILNGAAPGPSRARRVIVIVASIVGVLVFTLLLVGCGGSSATTITTTGSGSTTTASPSASGGQGATIQVVMTNRTFDPVTVTINVGDTVTWTNQDAPQHDVVAENGEFKSDLFDKGGTFSYTFSKAGTYPYFCSIHPGMIGTVIVQ